MMDLLRKILSNGYMLIIPVLIWNIAFVSYLPTVYIPENFNHNIPAWIIAGENLFRIFLFVFPLLLQINSKITFNHRGLIVYALGIAFYFLSWVVIIVYPSSAWSISIIGFTAPAYTPVIWIIGISMMADAYVFKSWIAYRKWHFLLPSLALIFFHIAHAIYVYNRTF